VAEIRYSKVYEGVARHIFTLKSIFKIGPTYLVNGTRIVSGLGCRAESIYFRSGPVSRIYWFLGQSALIKVGILEDMKTENTKKQKIETEKSSHIHEIW